MYLTRSLHVIKCRFKFPVFEKIVPRVLQRKDLKKGVHVADVIKVIAVT